MFRGFSFIERLSKYPTANCNDYDTDAPGLYSYVKYTDQLSTTDSDYQCKIDDPGCRFTTHVSCPPLGQRSAPLSVNRRKEYYNKRIRQRGRRVRHDMAVLTLFLYKKI